MKGENQLDRARTQLNVSESQMGGSRPAASGAQELERLERLERRVAEVEKMCERLTFTSPDSNIAVFGRFPNFVVKTSGATTTASSSVTLE